MTHEIALSKVLKVEICQMHETETNKNISVFAADWTWFYVSQDVLLSFRLS